MRFPFRERVAPRERPILRCGHEAVEKAVLVIEALQLHGVLVGVGKADAQERERIRLAEVEVVLRRPGHRVRVRREARHRGDHLVAGLQPISRCARELHRVLERQLRGTRLRDAERRAEDEGEYEHRATERAQRPRGQRQRRERVACGANSLPQQVEYEHRARDDDARDERDVLVAERVLRRAREHLAPLRRAVAHREYRPVRIVDLDDESGHEHAEEPELREQEQRRARLERDEAEELWGEATQDVARQDLGCATADRGGGLDVRREPDSRDLGTNELCALRPTHTAERDDEAEDRLVAQQDRDEQREKELWHPRDRVRDHGDGLLDRAAAPAAGDSEQERERGPQAERQQDHGEREACPPEDARELVATEWIRAERVERVGRRRWDLERPIRIEEDEALRLRIRGREVGAEQGDDRERQHSGESEQQRHVAERAARVASSHRAVAVTTRPATEIPPLSAASASAKIRAIVAANATLPFATARMKP